MLAAVASYARALLDLGEGSTQPTATPHCLLLAMLGSLHAFCAHVALTPNSAMRRACREKARNSDGLALR